MRNPWIFLFWFNVVLLVYVYGGYPVLLSLICRFRKDEEGVRGEEHILPSVTVVISARDEEKEMARKLDNCLEWDYPPGKMQIIVVSDGSVDRTAEIARGYGKEGVLLLELPGNQGKSSAQNLAVERASGEIVLFTDADVSLNMDALRLMVDNFRDDKVGCVVGRVSFEKEAGTAVEIGEGSYWRYETFIRSRESMAGNLLAGSGAIIALRRRLFEKMDPAVSEDFILPMKLALRDYRTIYEPKAVCVERSYSLSPGEKLRTRIRTVTLDARSIFLCRALLNPFRHPLYAWGLITHKILRWLVPYILAAVLGLNLLLMGNQLYRYILALQLLFYFLAAVGYLWNRYGKPPLWLSLPLSFCLINLAAMSGIARFVLGGRSAGWEPKRG